jgi:hypothetical protein
LEKGTATGENNFGTFVRRVVTPVRFEI